MMLPDQEAAMRTPEFQERYALGIADGLENSFGGDIAPDQLDAFAFIPAADIDADDGYLVIRRGKAGGLDIQIGFNV